VHAPDDPLASYNDARSMLARIPGSRWVHVERGGHIFIHKDERARAEIAAFLAANAPTETAEAPEQETVERYTKGRA
jgi:pimeloyl-ACP methyl ester carboxylesterase